MQLRFWLLFFPVLPTLTSNLHDPRLEEVDTGRPCGIDGYNYLRLGIISTIFWCWLMLVVVVVVVVVVVSYSYSYSDMSFLSGKSSYIVDGSGSGRYGLGREYFPNHWEPFTTNESLGEYFWSKWDITLDKIPWKRRTSLQNVVYKPECLSFQWNPGLVTYYYMIRYNLKSIISLLLMKRNPAHKNTMNSPTVELLRFP